MIRLFLALLSGSHPLTILTGKNYRNNLIQEFVKIKKESWILLIIVYISNKGIVLPHIKSVDV